MSAIQRYGREAEPPKEASLQETLRYLVDETQRRAYESTKGLTNDELSHDPGQGAWSIGQILNHQLYLMRMVTEFLEPGSTKDIPKSDLGQDGNWDLAAIESHRETLTERLLTVLHRTPPEVFMETRPNMRPDHWADWPVLMRFMRPVIDIATHTGQVNYARRQLGVPVGTVKK